jgi:hypothetical protein
MPALDTIRFSPFRGMGQLSQRDHTGARWICQRSALFISSARTGLDTIGRHVSNPWPIALTSFRRRQPEAHSQKIRFGRAATTTVARDHHNRCGRHRLLSQKSPNPVGTFDRLFAYWHMIWGRGKEMLSILSSAYILCGLSGSPFAALLCHRNSHIEATSGAKD